VTDDTPQKVGRPRATLTKEQVIELRALAAYLTEAQIADYFGLAERTLRNIFEREPEIYASYKQGAVRAVAKSAHNLTRIAWGYSEHDEDGNVTAVYQPDKIALMFHLKTKGGWRETDRLEVVTNNEPESAIDWTKVDNDIIKAVLAAARDSNENFEDDWPEPESSRVN